jgi:DNA-binding transcriptional LysR family regulator
MRELDLDRLRTLVTIADLGSFAAAARALHLAPPTVSLHVSELESRLDTPLLLRNEVQRLVEGRTGRVRVGASTGVLAHLLPQAVEVLSRDHPGIDVQVAVLTSQETMARLAGGTVDIGLVALPQAASVGLKVQPWRRDPVMAFVPASWKTPGHATPTWLAQQPLILNDASTRLSRLTGEWFAEAGEQPRPRIELNYNDAIKSLVAAGYGAALLPHEATAAQADKRIAMLPLKPKLWRPLGIAHRTGALEPSTAHVLDVLWRLRQT